MTRRGIILAGGTGTRLHPITKAVSKQLVPVYDKPMIYYPLSVLMLAGIREILIINTPHESEQFQRLLEDGSQWGLQIRYAVQPKPEGLAQAFIIGETFLQGEPSAMILGDNLFYGHGFQDVVRNATKQQQGATVFGYHTNNPSAYGVAEFDATGKVVGLEEKPVKPRSNYAVTGLYFYDANVCKYAKELKPSARGELEITDLNRVYLQRGELLLQKLGRGVAWLDTGTPEDMLSASNFIQTVVSRQGLQIACPEEIAFRSNWIDREQLLRQAAALGKTRYGTYLASLAEQDQ
ncbi:MAG TPA: glucose-1-phosphate thymidylyltransferase RfbA [Polyangiaceae bacterium]|jgi:glucose-1-phosphate thymidylyltransferase|nr:glucose-1-phosphate thymidylyltransferase RfbA [Polyangiaceae bacterium]